MRVSARGALLCASVALVLSSTGCQTYEMGQVLPSPGFLRDDIQYFPKGTDLSGYSQAKLNAVARKLNERPRKTLDYETPAKRFDQSVASIG